MNGNGVNDYVASLIRTLVPYLVGWLLTLPISHWLVQQLNVDSATATRNVSALATFVLGSAYYILVRTLEKKFPMLGVLLGVPRKPTYNVAGGTTGSATGTPAAVPGGAGAVPVAELESPAGTTLHSPETNAAPSAPSTQPAQPAPPASRLTVELEPPTDERTNWLVRVTSDGGGAAPTSPNPANGGSVAPPLITVALPGVPAAMAPLGIEIPVDLGHGAATNGEVRVVPMRRSSDHPTSTSAVHVGGVGVKTSH